MGKKVISFSLYGKHPDYTLGAIANARHANRAYPGWICRFYVADDVPKSIVSRLKIYGAEVVNMGRRVEHEARLWRFFAAIDPEVEMAVFRDTDSRFTKCELVMVNDWLASDKKFHVMRWDYSPEVSVMGGLWGLRGNISELRDPLESASSRLKGSDEKFLNRNLTPKMKGKVYVNELHTSNPRHFFIGETIHPFPQFAYTERGFFLNMLMPIGMRIPSRRKFIVLSIYKNTPLYEYFLAQLINNIENQNLFRLQRFTHKGNHLKARFYVADNIRPDLIERLRRLGQVILRPAKTTHKDDPKYWKLSILSESGMGMAMIIGFWEFFFLARAGRFLEFSELMSMESDSGLTGIESRAKTIFPLSICGPDIPVVDIENLIAQRNPNESYQQFIRSTVYPRISDVRMMVRLQGIYDSDNLLKYGFRLLFPPSIYATLSGIRKYLKVRIFSFKR